LRRSEWVLYAKRPFAGPEAAHLDDNGVTFKWKDYRIKGRYRLRTMTLDGMRLYRSGGNTAYGPMEK
jgi:hypothetical protein